jgi:hypothetical protein
VDTRARSWSQGEEEEKRRKKKGTARDEFFSSQAAAVGFLRCLKDYFSLCLFGQSSPL